MAKKKKPIRKKKSAGKKSRAIHRPIRRPIARRKKVQVTPLDVVIPSTRRGLGAHSAGQSGDTQGLSNVEEIDSESVEELVEEGQNFEAGAVAGVEDADASQEEVRTRQVLEDDVPLEYLETDLDQLNRPRKPLPQEPLDKRLGERRGKQMGQKNAKRADRGGRR